MACNTDWARPTAKTGTTGHAAALGQAFEGRAEVRSMSESRCSRSPQVGF